MLERLWRRYTSRKKIFEFKFPKKKIGRITDGERLRLLTLQNQLDKSGNSTSSEETQQLQVNS